MISRITPPDSHVIYGKVKCGKRTKNLIPFLSPGDIALIDHRNLDSVAAMGLVEKKVQGIINCSPTFTGEYITMGAKQILDCGIPIFEYYGKDDLFHLVEDGEEILIMDGTLVFPNRGKRLQGILHPLSRKKWTQEFNKAHKNMSRIYSEFIDNTLGFIKEEKVSFMSNLPVIPMETKVAGRPIVVVIRGKHYKEDLASLLPFISRENPILLGVDGGADALLEYNLSPDIIIGDMDSVSDEALYKAKDVIVHAYCGGFAPGEKRVKQTGVPYHLLPAPGVSEDVAMLFAYEQGASLIVGIGYHSCMVDFLEKGRKGMGSTLLVRMKIDDRFIDARGINLLGLDVKRVGYQHHYSRF